VPFVLHEGMKILSFRSSGLSKREGPDDAPFLRDSASSELAAANTEQPMIGNPGDY
jgi:hypothetical protein